MSRFRSIFESAVVGVDGTVNVGYLVLLRSGQAVIGVAVALTIMGGVGVGLKPELAAETIKSTGMAIGAVLGAYGATLSGVGVFLWGDKNNVMPRPAPAPEPVKDPA